MPDKPLQGHTATKTIITGRDIVVVGIQPWYYELGSNCKNIARQLSLHNRVLYVNIPVSRKTYFSKNKNQGLQRHCDIIRQKKERIYSISKNLWEFYPTRLIEPANSIPSTALFRIINKANNRRYAKDISEAIAQMGFKDIILFNDNDFYTGYHLKQLLSPKTYVYYMRDFLQGNPYWKKHSSAMEPELIGSSDLVVTNSVYYNDYCLQYNPHSFYIGQGCNIEFFNNDIPHPAAEGMDHISSPVIGYVGAVDSGRLDLQIIDVIAKANPKWQVVMVGPEDDTFKKSNLHGRDNIHFLGRKDIKQLPGYIQAFDVCINPQSLNQLTQGNYPLKIDEYLAMGKAVVATRTKTMELFKAYTYLADAPEEYPALIAQALQEDSAERKAARIAFARTHTWENSTGDLYAAIRQHSA